jgi:hypothetical protein
MNKTMLDLIVEKMLETLNRPTLRLYLWEWKQDKAEGAVWLTGSKKWRGVRLFTSGSEVRAFALDENGWGVGYPLEIRPEDVENPRFAEALETWADNPFYYGCGDRDEPVSVSYVLKRIDAERRAQRAREFDERRRQEWLRRQEVNQQ